MKLVQRLPDAAPSWRGTASIVGLVALLSSGLVLPLGGAEAATTVPLGTAETFAVLAGSTITNTGQSVIAGDVGLHPGTAVTGFGPGADAVTHEGSLYVADDVALQAKADLDVAYTNASGQTPVTEVPTELGGTTLTRGVYDSASGTFGITGELTLDADGDPDAVFVFQTGTTLTTASASTVNLIGDANICNVFWQVGSSATLGSDSTFRGTIMADQSVSLTTGTVVEGRVLARVAAVTMDTNTITNAACSSPRQNDTPVEDDTPVDDATPIEDDTPVDDATPIEDATPVEGPTPVDDGTPTEVDTPTDTPTPVPTPPGDGTTTQIPRVPSGPVPTGGGDAPGSPGVPLLLAGLLLLMASAATGGVVVRRRLRA